MSGWDFPLTRKLRLKIFNYVLNHDETRKQLRDSINAYFGIEANSLLSGMWKSGYFRIGDVDRVVLTDRGCTHRRDLEQLEVIQHEA